MDIAQVNAQVRKFLRFNSLNDIVQLDLPVFYDGLWYTQLLVENRVIGTIVTNDEGVLKDLSTDMEDICNELRTYFYCRGTDF